MATWRDCYPCSHTEFVSVRNCWVSVSVFFFFCVFLN